MTGPLLPAAAARRQHVLNRYTEMLCAWGAPDAHAADRAQALLEVAVDAGYRLPPALDDVPQPRAGGQYATEQGRTAAMRRIREELETRARRRSTP